MSYNSIGSKKDKKKIGKRGGTILIRKQAILVEPEREYLVYLSMFHQVISDGKISNALPMRRSEAEKLLEKPVWWWESQRTVTTPFNFRLWIVLAGSIVNPKLADFRRRQPSIPVVFLTDTAETASDALAIGASVIWVGDERQRPFSSHILDESNLRDIFDLGVQEEARCLFKQVRS